MHQDYGPPGIVVLTGAGISKESGIDTFRDPDGLWNRGNLEDVATLEAEYGGDVTIVTQNIDLLHEMAGSKNVIHMHGREGEVRCMRCGTVSPSDADLSVDSVCLNCRAVGELRPNIVWFGEEPMRLDEIYAALGRCGLFIAIGTSAQVYPAAGFVLHVRRRAHVRTVELNLEPTENQPLFGEHIYGPATRIVPAYVERILAGAAL